MDKKNERKRDKVKATKKCPNCKCDMKYRGPKNSCGTVYWKCRNKKCGRTVNINKEPIKPVEPLCYSKDW